MISILIPTINYSNYLKFTCDSITKNTQVPHEIIVFDNASTDDTEEWCSNNENIVYIRSPKNVGLAKAYNEMVRNSKYDLILFGNNDYYMLPNWDSAVLEVNEHGGWRSPMQIERNRPTRSITADYGSCPEDFREEDIIRDFSRACFPDRRHAAYMPNVLVKEDFWNFGGYHEDKFFNGIEFLWRAYNWYKERNRFMITCPTSFFYHFRCVTDLVEYEGEQIDWRKILRQENRDFLDTVDVTEEEIDREMNHYGYFGPSLNADNQLILYP